jgi:carbamoyltransferase
MRVLGVSAFYHDSAAALVDERSIIAAAQQERFTRKKHDAGFPDKAIEYCLSEGGCRLSDVDWVVFYDKPFLKFERLLETYLAFAPRGFGSFRAAMPVWLKQKLFQKDMLRKALLKFDPDFDWKHRLLFTEHHLSHAASAYFASSGQRPQWGRVVAVTSKLIVRFISPTLLDCFIPRLPTTPALR